MKTFSIFLKSLFLAFIISCLSNAYADGHKEIKGPQFEYFGSLSYLDITRINE